MSVICPSCGQETPEGFPRCANCGSALEATTSPPREERKVVTCLFCDLVGFTAKAERLDPEDVRQVLQPYHHRLRSELERHGGTVEKFIGDAVMAVFGAPVAHEDDPERAVRAALAIREALAEEGDLEVRIGITTGEALIALGARPEAGEGMASGDVVNTAARLQSAAPVNGILVDETTYRATDRAIEYGDEHAIEAKGKAEPLAVREVRRARARVSVERVGGAPLVGREREVTLLRETLARVVREREPQLMTLVGVPGIGKSRLVYELFQTIESGDFGIVFWRHGRSLPYGEGVTFWALGEMVKAQAGILESDGTEQVADKLRGAVARFVEDSEDAAWVERHLRPLTGLESDEPRAGDRRSEAFAAWRRFLEAIADERPLVLVFEDLHWADDALLDFVEHLVDWASGVPILALCTARPELLTRRPGWGGGKVNSSTLQLSALSEEETTKLLHALLGRSALDAGVQERLLEHAGGNPLYAEEFTRMLTSRPGDAVVLPETVQGIIAARLDTLPAEEKELLQSAAVLGRTFWLGALEGERWTLEERLHVLERKSFVGRQRSSSVSGEHEYAFRHALVREVAYEQIPRARRAKLHRAAAGWIESLGRVADHAEMLAYHYASALEYVRAAGADDSSLVVSARDAAREAGDRAYSFGAFDAAERFYTSALELCPPEDPERPELLLLRGRMLHYTADLEAERVLEEAAQLLEIAGSPVRVAEAHLLLSEIWWDRGQRDRSYEELEHAATLLGDDPSETKARVLGRFARSAMIADELDEALRIGSEALALAEDLGLPDLRAHVLNTLGAARFYLGDVSGLDVFEQSVEIARSAGSHMELGSAYNNLGFMHTLAGDVRRDRELREEAMRVASRVGEERMVRFVNYCLPMLDYFSGDWEESLARADRAVEEVENGNPHYLEPNIRWTRALLRTARGDLEGASADARRAEEAARDAKDPQIILPSLAVRLRLALDCDDPADAIGVARELLASEPRHAARPPSVELAWAASRLEIAEDTRRWVQRVPHPSRWTDATVAILDEKFELAADVFAEIGSLPDEAFSRLRAGDEKNVRRALAFFQSVGATRYLAEGEAMLAKTA